MIDPLKGTASERRRQFIPDRQLQSVAAVHQPQLTTTDFMDQGQVRHGR
jgi:hypothetical protein